MYKKDCVQYWKLHAENPPVHLPNWRSLPTCLSLCNNSHGIIGEKTVHNALSLTSQIYVFYMYFLYHIYVYFSSVLYIIYIAWRVECQIWGEIQHKHKQFSVYSTFDYTICCCFSFNNFFKTQSFNTSMFVLCTCKSMFVGCVTLLALLLLLSMWCYVLQSISPPIVQVYLCPDVMQLYD